MRILLDTHSFLWFVTDDPQLSATAKASIEDPMNERLLSIASLWEMAIKYSIGKLELDDPPERFFKDQLSQNAIGLLPISVEHVVRVATLPLHHRDPFDRLIVCQSLVEQIGVVSIDARFDAYSVARIW